MATPRRFSFTWAALAVGLGAVAAWADVPGSAFDFEHDPSVKRAVDLKDVMKGIARPDPRDAIPPIYEPKLVPAREASWLADEDRVLGLDLNGHAHAYPIRILDRHEVVNDELGAERVVVSYCPLCASGTAFEAKVGGKATHFGVSGYLYQSDLLLWDHATESFWSQIEGRAVVGPATGAPLRFLPVENTTWKRWRERHPETLVLAKDQGIYPAHVYDRKAYPGYADRDEVMFPVKQRSDRYPAKTLVAGIALGDAAKAYPLPELEKAGRAAFDDTVGGKKVRVTFDREAGTVAVADAAGKPIPVLRAYWFAWFTFHPKTEIYRR